MLTAHHSLTIPFPSLSRPKSRQAESDSRSPESATVDTEALETPLPHPNHLDRSSTAHEAEALVATLLFAVLAAVALVSIRYLSFTNLIPETVQLTTWDLVHWMESLH